MERPPHLLLLLLVSLTAAGCPQDPPPPVAQAPETKTAEPVKSAEPSAEVKTAAPAPAEQTDAPPPQKTKPAARKSPRKPLNLLDGVAKRSKVDDVDLDALNRKPRKVKDRTQLAEDRARSSGGRSTWARDRDGKKKGAEPVRWKPLPKRKGAPRRTMPTMHTRPVLAAWRALGQAKQSKNWRAYYRGHALNYQRQMVTGAISSFLNWSLMFKRSKTEPHSFKIARDRLTKHGIPASKIKARPRSGPKGGWSPPPAQALAGLVKDQEACYVDLMKTISRRNASGAFEGAYTPGDLAEMQFTTDGRHCRALLLQPGGKQSLVAFRKSGRSWVLAGLRRKK